MPTCFGGVPLPPGEGGAKRRVRGVKPRERRPSSGASRHLLPEGEGLDLPFRLIWTVMVIDRPYSQSIVIRGEMSCAEGETGRGTLGLSFLVALEGFMFFVVPARIIEVRF